MIVNRRNFLGSALAEVNIRGARVMEARARVLSATDIHAHNSFTNPRALEPRDEKVNVGDGGQLVYRFQPASVTRLQIDARVV